MPYDSQDEVPDDALLVLYANGDQTAARMLTIRLTPKIFGHAYRVLGNRAEAEDVAQDALMRLWKIAPEWRQGEAKVTTWLYRVVANLCTDRLRRRREVDIDTVPEPEDDTAGPAEVLQNRSRMAALQEALAELPDRQRQAVVLRHIDGLGNPEIAGIMDISVEAAESLTARGKRMLARILSGRREELGYSDG